MIDGLESLHEWEVCKLWRVGLRYSYLSCVIVSQYLKDWITYHRATCSVSKGHFHSSSLRTDDL